MAYTRVPFSGIMRVPIICVVRVCNDDATFAEMRWVGGEARFYEEVAVPCPPSEEGVENRSYLSVKDVAMKRMR